MPVVSVVIPTYNRAHLLGAAIESVLGQTFGELEIIVVDDASGDDPRAVVARFADPRVRYFRQGRNQGDAAARNAGVDVSRGEYVAFLDDDDQWLREKLQTQLDHMSRSGAEVAGVHTARFVTDTATGCTKRESAPHGSGAGLRIVTSSMVVRRRCLEEVGPFDESNPYSSDFDMWIRIAGRFRLEYIDVPLVRSLSHGERLSTNLAKVIKGKETILRKHAAFLAKDRVNFSEQYLDLGVHYCYVGNIRAGRSAIAKAIRVYPYDLRHYFNLGLALLVPKKFGKIKQFKERVFGETSVGFRGVG